MVAIGNAQLLGERDNQEDYFATSPILGGMLCLVADGMGGYEGGEVASRLGAHRFIGHFSAAMPHLCPLDNLEASLQAAHEAIREHIRAHPDLEAMGTTLIAAVIRDNSLMWLNVGDSPLYRFRNGTLTRLNANHSIAGELALQVAAGTITPEQAAASPDAHMLTSAVSADDIALIECTLGEPPRRGDLYLLASDGIHTLADDEIARIAAHASDPQALAEALICAVAQKKRRHQDNTTVIAAKIIKETA